MNLIELPEAMMRGIKPTISPIVGTWIAGGAVRKWFNPDSEPTDIDVFGQTVEKLDEYKKSIEALHANEISSNKNATSYTLNGTVVQVITVMPFPSIEALLDHFDFHICQFAWDGKKIFTTTEAIISVLRGHLSVNKVHPEFAVDSLRRAFKYQKKGFIPCAGTIRDIAHSLRGLTEQQVNDAIAISPGGGNRTVRFD